MNPHQVTKDFEQALCDYTGAPCAVAVNSCTMALLLTVAWHVRQANGFSDYCEWTRNRPSTAEPWKWISVEIPKRTYVSVPMSILHAGGRPTFRDEDWRGAYQLKPYQIWDSARWFTAGLYRKLVKDNSYGFICVSFHANKTLGIEQGGAILHGDTYADAWLRRARFDGRTEGVPPAMDKFQQVGFHCYINPSTAAQGLLKIYSMRDCENPPMPNDDYPDLSSMEIFK